jgi:carbon monoxide dehydrogenase subunit G
MDLEHEFAVPVPVDQAWPVLLDVERIAPCMPGATLDTVDGDEFTGRLKVKLGAMTITYKGAARIASRDESAHIVTIEGTGKEARGSGTASATVQAQLHPEGEQTRVTVHTKLNITGRPAQFGRNIMAEVGGKLIGRFAGNLAKEIASPAGPAAPAETGTAEAGTAAGGATPAKDAGAAEAAGATPAKDASAAETAGTAPAKDASAAETAGAGVAEAEAQTAPTETATGDGGPAAETAPVRPSGDEAPAAETAPAPPSGDGAPEAPAAAPRVAPAASTAAGEGTPEAPRRIAPRASDDDAIDLLEFAGPSIAKRLAPVVAGLVAVWALRRFLRRPGRRRSGK